MKMKNNFFALPLFFKHPARLKNSTWYSAGFFISVEEKTTINVRNEAVKTR